MRDRFSRFLHSIITLAGRPRTSLVPAIAAGVWLLAVVTAMAVLSAYTNEPGDSKAAPATWPADSTLPFDGRRPALVLIAHPHCPCTRATIGELERIMAGARGRIEAHVLFIRPVDTAEDWAQTDLWATASAIPGVTVHRDDAGIESRRFQAATSGDTLLYGRDGRLLFQGGITISRGHAGDSPGRSAILACLEQNAPGERATPVFGCPLFATETQKRHLPCKQ